MSVSGRTTTALCLLILLPTFVAGQTVAPDPQSLPGVEDLRVDGDGDSVEITLSASPEVAYTYFRLDGPRLVVDLHDAENRLGFSTRPIGAGGVSQVRAGAFSDETRDVTRVVFDLEDGTRYRISEDEPGLIRVRFEAVAGVVEAAVAEPAEAVRSVSAPRPDTIAVSEVETVEVGKEVAEVVTEVAEVEVGESVEAEAGLSEPFQVASLVPSAPPLPEVVEASPAITPTASETAQPRPVSAPAPVALDPALPSAAPAGSERPRLQDLGAFSEPDLALLAGAAGPAAPAEPVVSPQVISPIPVPQYTGEIYSFDFRNLELVDFFRTMAEISGLNVILDPNIPNQTLNMVLVDVPWDQALDIVLRTYNLAWEQVGNVIRIALQTTLQQEEERRQQYRELQLENGPLLTHTYVLSYTEAETAGPLVDGQLTSRGTVVAVPEKNALMVTDIENRFEQIENLIGFLDTPAQQVEIVARLLQANKNFRRELGNQLGAVFNINTQSAVTGLPTLPSPFIRSPAPSVTAGGADAIPLIADFGLAAPTSGLSFLLGVGGDVLLDSIIQAAETRGTARLLSRPNVVVQNNEAAIIEQGTQIPVQTNVNNTISVQFQQFALRLEVTPQITEEGTILLNAIIENSTPDFSQQVDGIPSIATQRAQTRVLIGDGETAYVGGILVDSDTVNVSQVPGLGNVPIIGDLFFKSTSTVKTTSELLFFVTARIKPAEPIDFLSDAASTFSPEELENLFASEPPLGILREGAVLGPAQD